MYVNIKSGKYTVVNRQRPPILGMMNPLVEQTISRGVSNAIGNSYTRNSLKVSSKVANNNYAVIISGGADAYNNWERYWNDCSAMYKILVNVYNYPKDHIYVIMADGTSTGKDMHLYDGTYKSSPLDLDNDGTADIQYAATCANIRTVFNKLANILTANDDLFIFTTDHGGSEGNKRSYMYLWNDDILYDSDFASYINKLKANVINICMEQCFSGGFIDDITKNNVTIATACRHDEYSWPMTSVSYMYNEFAYHWMSAVAEMTPYGSKVSADANNDGKISMAEAFNYAKSKDSQNEHPQYKSLPSTLGQSVCLVSNFTTPPAAPTGGIANFSYNVSNKTVTIDYVSQNVRNTYVRIYRQGTNTCLQTTSVPNASTCNRQTVSVASLPAGGIYEVRLYGDDAMLDYKTIGTPPEQEPTPVTPTIEKSEITSCSYSSGSISVGYKLASSAKTAEIRVLSTQNGSVVTTKTLSVNPTTGTTNIYSSSLKAGMYAVVLFVNGSSTDGKTVYIR